MKDIQFCDGQEVTSSFSKKRKNRLKLSAIGTDNTMSVGMLTGQQHTDDNVFLNIIKVVY